MAGLLYLQHAIDASRLSADRTRHRSHKIRRQAGPRNPLKGTIGAVLHAVMCGAGHNIRLLLKKLRLLCARIADAEHAASIYPHGLGWLKTAWFSADSLADASGRGGTFSPGRGLLDQKTICPPMPTP